MHNLTFSMAQYRTLSFPQTIGVKADYMGKAVNVKMQTAAHSKRLHINSLLGNKKKKSEAGTKDTFSLSEH